jgi:Tol biopolymer transport system component
MSDVQDQKRLKSICLFSFLLVVIATFYIFCAILPMNIPADEIKVSNEWGPPERLPYPVNSPEWEDGPSISPDGKTLYFARGRDLDVKTYLSEKIAGGWSQPIPLDINLESFPTGAPHTQDGKILYFASVRPGVVGSGDIFVSRKVNGKWKEVMNLGKSINTKDMESEPFISLNNRELYFASTRKGGKGDADIWMAQKTKNRWNKPINLGSPVNSEFEETQPFVTQDGKELYFVAVNRKGIPGPAIFKSVKQGEKWGEVQVVISGFVGEPTLTADQKTLFFVHLIRKSGKLIDGEIMFTRRRNN